MKEMVAKHLRARLSAQKTRLVADMIRGKHVARALEILAFSQQKAALLLRKVLESAIANAESQEGYDVDDLCVLSVYVDRGPFLKRFMARAKGRGARILKPTCNIRIAVGPRIR